MMTNYICPDCGAVLEVYEDSNTATGSPGEAPGTDLYLVFICEECGWEYSEKYPNPNKSYPMIQNIDFKQGEEDGK